MRLRRGDWIEVALGVVAWAAIALGAAVVLGGCGSAIRTHARIATVATVGLEGADRAYDAAVAARLGACADHACVDTVEGSVRPVAVALDATAAVLGSYVAALELAQAAGDGADVASALGVALGRLAESWEALRVALAAEGVDVPALPVGGAP